VGILSGLLESLDADAGRRGKQFEHICKWFLMNDPVYRQQLRRVWLWKEWRDKWGPDAGIDLVAEDCGGQLWAIQAKAYDPAYSITKHDVDTFLSESARPEFSFRLLIATTDRIRKTAARTLQAQEKPASRLLLADLRSAQVSWPRSPSDLRPAKLRPKRPRPYQREAITAVVCGFESADRGQMIMACGTGKTLTALFIAQRLAARRTLVLVPSLSLLTDTLREWTANDENFEFLPVCSDDTVTGSDAAVSSTTDLGFPVTTDPLDIATFLRRRSDSRRVMFATYQSSPKIAEAYGLGRVPAFDLVIADEAHRCASRVSSDFAIVLDDDAIPGRKRLFMTATPRFFTGRVVKEAKGADFEVASMDDESRFGPVLHRLGFAEAIDRELLTAYQVVVVGVDDATYLDWAQRGRFVTTDGTKVTDARTLAGQIGLAKAMRRYDLRRTISFHSRVSAARQFANSMPELIDWMPVGQRPKGQIWSHYASGEMSAGDRSRLLDHLRFLDSDERGLLANARCLGEGIDVPALDGVAFIDPRRSEVDIVQAVGRAIRLAGDKTVGTIVIPVFIEAGDDPEVALDTSAFKPVWDVVRALRAHDDELGAQLDELRRELGRGRTQLRSPAKIHFDLPARISSDFARAIDVHLVELTTTSWEEWFGLLEAYAEEHGDCVIAKEATFRGDNLGSWAAVQRVNWAKGRLDAGRIARLEALPGWWWNILDYQWEAGYAALLRYVEREGTAKVPHLWIEDGYRLGQWVTSIRNRYAKGRFDDPQRIEILQALPGWSWNTVTDSWETGFEHLERYVAEFGTSQVPRDYVINGYPLGRWAVRQRNTMRDSTDDPRHRRLSELPRWRWRPYDDQWERGFAAMQEYVARTGTALVPQDHHELDGFRLGAWVSSQRGQHSKGRLSDSRAERLEAVAGWSWDPHSSNWEEGFRHLIAYVDEHSHAGVPVDFVDDEEFSLGQWARVQRVQYAAGKVPKDRAERLQSLLGWRWDTYSEGWEENFAILERYVARTGTARVHRDHVEEGVPLGTWAGNQRAFFRRGKLSADRVARLEALPGWQWRLPKGPARRIHD